MPSKPAALLVSWLLLIPAFVFAGDWPQFRGPSGEGHVADRGYPLTWSETEHVTWKVPVPGLGWSSPVIVGPQIWLTTALVEKVPAAVLPKENVPPKVETPPEPKPAAASADASKATDGAAKPTASAPPAKKPPALVNVTLRAICLDRATGKTIHDIELFKKQHVLGIHGKNSHASPTPIVEDGRVYVHFGAHGTACLTTDGKIVWRTEELKYEHRHGPGGSPVLFGDLLLVSCDGTDVQYLAALDKRTGAVRWKRSRDGKMAYSTPLLVPVDGRPQLISTGGNSVTAYDPANGDEIWQVKYDGYSLVPRPVVGHGLAFICTGYDRPSLLAVRLGGRGDITESHVAWKLDKAVPHNPSPLLLGELLYLISDKGILTCVRASTGEEAWHQRVGGNFSASPSDADGRIYLTDEEGKTTVIAPGEEYKELAVNQVDGRTLASLAFADRAIYLRTDTHLYRIEER